MDVIRNLARFAEFILVGLGGPAMWTISVSGRVVGSLTHEAGKWRLAWFENADPRLREYRGPVNGDVEALGASLGAIVGVPVSFDSVIL